MANVGIVSQTAAVNAPVNSAAQNRALVLSSIGAPATAGWVDGITGFGIIRIGPSGGAFSSGEIYVPINAQGKPVGSPPLAWDPTTWQLVPAVQLTPRWPNTVVFGLPGVLETGSSLGAPLGYVPVSPAAHVTVALPQIETPAPAPTMLPDGEILNVAVSSSISPSSSAAPLTTAAPPPAGAIGAGLTAGATPVVERPAADMIPPSASATSAWIWWGLGALLALVVGALWYFRRGRA